MQTQILGLLTPLMALLFAVMFAVLWRAGKMQRHVLGFSLAYAFSAVGFLITHFFPADAIYVWHATQLFYSLGSVAMVAAVCERAGQRLNLGAMAGVYLISAAMLATAIGFSSDVSSRLVIINMGYGVMFTIGVTSLLMARRRTVFDNLIIAVIALQAIDFFVRPTLTLLFERSIPAEVYRESVYYSLIGLALGVKGVVNAVVLIGATLSDWITSLRESSERDELTGLQNRGAFDQTMRELVMRARNEGRPLSLVVADIDHFKQVNDIWGHQAGDTALSAFGELIAGKIRTSDRAGRVGGEEFCIAVWDCENAPAGRLAERIRQAFAGMQHDGLNDDVRLTASFGVATARDGESYEELFSRADEVLYRAKSRGRDRVETTDKQPLEAPDAQPTAASKNAPALKVQRSA